MPRSEQSAKVMNHVHALSPDRNHLEISFPHVEGYAVSADGGGSKVPRYAARPDSTRDVDFWTSRPVLETTRSHINFLVADNTDWDHNAVYCFETNPYVTAYVKNFNLGFVIPYEHGGVMREYSPDFLVRMHKDGRGVGTLILATSGHDPLKRIEIDAAQRWVAAVTAEGSHGRWAYRIVRFPEIVPAALESAARELADPPPTDWRVAATIFCFAMQRLYGARLDSVVLYGSRARGDAEWDSDVDLLVVLDKCGGFWSEFDRIVEVTSRIFSDHGVLLSARPTDVTELRESRTSLFANARKEGRKVA